MRLTFYIDRPDATISTVMVNVAFSGKRFRFSTGVSIAPSNWNHERQEIRSLDPDRGAHMKRLHAIEAEIRSAYHAIPFGKDGKIVGQESINQFQQQVKNFLSADENSPRGDTIYEYIEEFVESYRKASRTGMVTNQRPGDSTLGRYRLVARRLKHFSDVNHVELTFSGIDEHFYREFVAWLSTDQNLFDGAVGNHIKVLKTFMRWSQEQGYHDNNSYTRFYKPDPVADTIALSANELRSIRDADLTDSPKLARVRDHFLLQAYTGLRYGDLVKIGPQNFDQIHGFIHVPITKTEIRPIIPITSPLELLLERYPSLLFEFNSIVKANLYLKELGKRVGLDSPVVESQSKNGKRFETTVPKHMLLTTHVARRSFVTISLEFGLQDSFIRLVTGHRTNDVMQAHYAKPSAEVVREAVRNAWRIL